ncbi:p21-C-terminal region-binding protein-domain-containing protein [Gloeopeniophorella convolvens]|nr:p21-C-terminal region-binding protein-domain-containing protein [Gloeopeniophorella convolvens]
MPKRKQDGEQQDEDVGGDTETSRIQVDFEFFDPNPDIDFIALKRLIGQLFQTDIDLIQPQELAELILSQPLVGTTIKTDGRESDPYAFLTVLNMQVHKENPSIQAIASYVLSKAVANPALHNTLQTILAPGASSHVGFIFSERLINMPVEVVPHMYRMLVDEIQWACDDGEPYHFSHLLVLSRTYVVAAEDAEAEAAVAQQQKRRKGAAAPSSTGGTFSFHHEDECIQQLASYSLDYPLTHAVPRDKESFGLEQGGRLMLISADKLPQLVQNLTTTFPQPSQ